MTSRRTKITTTIAAAAAMGGAGFGLLAAPAGAATAASAATAPSATAAACDNAPWEPKVQGDPVGFGAGSPSGDYLWHDGTGFHLRVTHGNSKDLRVYSGEIHSSAPMRIDPVRLEKGDTVKLSASHQTLVFVFANHGYVDGVNFHTDCANSLGVSRLHVGNNNLPASQVYLGHTGAHPAHVPFTVKRLPTTHS